MKSILILRATLVMASLLFVFSLSGYSQRVDCSKTTDAETVNTIYAKMKDKYEAEMSHVNIRIDDNVVTLEGWVTEKSVKKAIEKYAKKTSCVKKVDNQLSVGIGGGCGPGQKACGDICIGSDRTCNIRGKEN